MTLGPEGNPPAFGSSAAVQDANHTLPVSSPRVARGEQVSMGFCGSGGGESTGGCAQSVRYIVSDFGERKRSKRKASGDKAGVYEGESVQLCPNQGPGGWRTRWLLGAQALSQEGGGGKQAQIQIPVKLKRDHQRTRQLSLPKQCTPRSHSQIHSQFP
jgi:hypothetical protein